jgi:hypothetical protein
MKRNLSISRVFSGIATGVILSMATAGAIVAHGVSQADSRRQELADARRVMTDEITPSGTPLINQASIDLAAKVFGIQIPKGVRGPYFDQKLEDRGLTLRRGLASDPVVLIGREAFSSWGMLGSTLAHEIEIHCRQNFLAIHLQNLAGFDGTGVAEREAYRYELLNAERFGLAQYDRELIRSTMSYFYPEQENNLARRFVPVRAWLDRLSASGGKVRSF